MKFQLFKLGENDKRFLQLRRIWRLRWPCSLSSLRSGTLLGASLLLLGQLDLVTPLGRCSAILMLMMLLLDDFLGVRDVSWISHQFIDGSQRLAGRISQLSFARICVQNSKLLPRTINAPEPGHVSASPPSGP